jgi:nucleoside triphosphate diphosphatase
VFSELLEVVRLLRRRCPWDRKQTLASTRPMLLNETYELDEALRQRDGPAITEELGDYLFMGLFLAEVAGKELGISLEDSLRDIVAKLKQRHPHIYGTAKVRGPGDVLANWERIKAKHKRGGGLLSSIPVALPALRQAQLVQERCRRVGFDWDKPEQVLDKVEEEIGELRQELRRGRKSRARVKEELGDLLFALVNLARHLDVDAEGTLKDASAKFRARFRCVEEHFAVRGRELGQVSLDEMEAVWQEAKLKEGKAPRPKSGTTRQRAKSGSGKGEMPKSEKGRGRKARSGRK